VAAESMRGRRSAGQGWIATLVGVLVLVTGGFVLGLIVGVVSEEPDLVVGHVAGHSEEVEWAGEPQLEKTPPVGAGPSYGRLTGPDPSVPLAETAPPSIVPDRIGPPAVSAPPPTVERAAAPAPTPSANPAVATRKAAAAGGESQRFAIQVGAFGDAASARSLAGRLDTKGYPTLLVEPTTDDRWRVRVGPIEGRAEADRTARKLKVQEQLPTWVLPEPGH
jgi:DedD protein